MITTTQNKQECKREKKTGIISCRRNPDVYGDSRRIFR